jgi:hypothetical protein
MSTRANLQQAQYFEAIVVSTERLTMIRIVVTRIVKTRNHNEHVLTLERVNKEPVENSFLQHRIGTPEGRAQLFRISITVKKEEQEARRGIYTKERRHESFASHMKQDSTSSEAELCLFIATMVSRAPRRLCKGVKIPHLPSTSLPLMTVTPLVPFVSRSPKFIPAKVPIAFPAQSSHRVFGKPGPSTSHILAQCGLLRCCVRLWISTEDDRGFGGMEGREVRNGLRVWEGGVEQIPPGWVSGCGAFVGCDYLRALKDQLSIDLCNSFVICVQSTCSYSISLGNLRGY